MDQFLAFGAGLLTLGLTFAAWLLVYLRYVKDDRRPAREMWREWQARKDGGA